MDSTEISVVGNNEGVTPVLESWDWTVAGYLFIGGLVGGLMIFAGYFMLRKKREFDRGLRIADLAGLPLLALGLALLFADLSNKENAWRFFTTFRPSSPMSWGSWILAVATVLLGLRFIRHHRLLPWDLPQSVIRLLDRVTRWTDTIARPVAGASMVVGTSLALYTGFLLSTITARPIWDSGLLPPLFLISGIASAGAFLCLWLESEAHRKLAPLSVSLCLVELALLFTYLATVRSPGSFGPDLLTTGSFAGWFWALVVFGGLLIPVTLEISEIRHWVSQRVAHIAPYLKLAGAAGLRFVVLFAGLESIL